MMAKSLEDTAFYRHHRLVALNEVGGNPDAGALSVVDFHRRMQERATGSPHGLTATATHDTKRGEDARARLLALSELAQDWTKSMRTWQEHNAHLVRSRGATRIPSAAHEYMLYQAVLGAWPLDSPENFIERIQGYALKAAREGKEQTSWIEPDQDYESGLADFIRGILDPARSPAFLESFGTFAQRVALIGALNSLIQVTLKTTMPGIPDFYQGTEFWDLSLVDPDNRRPVDFAARAQALPVAHPDWPALAHSWGDGRIKLALTASLLAARRAYASVFATGEYQPLEVGGRHRDEIIAFARCEGADAILVVAGRLFGRASSYGRGWPSSDAWDATVSVGGFSGVRHLLADRPAPRASQLAIRDLFDALPIALLQAQRG
jgi:(1->4)-alpha-D-glucan 1-alpha-D-glucosylmutase